MIPYLDCQHPDESGITIEFFSGLSEIPYIQHENAVSIHQHDFYEMVLILRGTCQHYYRGSRIPLIPGDLFLVPPDQPHSYQFQENISLCNCQFYRSALGSAPEHFVSDIEYTALQQKTSSHKRLQDMQAFCSGVRELSLRHVGNINSQGIIHLDRAEREFLFSNFVNLLSEQRDRKFGFERVKQMLLEHILIQIKRVQMNQFENLDRSVTWQDEMVDTVLNAIEGDLTAEYDFNQIAEEQNISISYFRSIFKSITGLSPVEYLNRVRILHALELLQTTRDSIAEVAAKVGIYDPNYFSRLFKKIIGYPPRYFKAIEPEAAGDAAKE